MAFKDLFFVNDDKKDDKKKTETKEVQSSFENKFPSSGPVNETKTATPVAQQSTATMEPITPENPACAPHLEKIMKLYEDGFNGLNMAGYDFFEYFQAVVQTAINNPAMYGMALTMAKAMDPTVSKQSLISQSEFYVTEINKVYQHYVENGTTKRKSALEAKGSEETSLTNELNGINSEIARLTQLKAQKESELATIDNKYSPQITEIECKLMANDIARERILASIKTVVDGINNNL